jgi:DNA-binding transcriptional LysR family regulator
MDTLDSLRIFIRVAEQGGFARAAENLGLSRAAVSVAVQRLEATLGTQLLHRTTRKVQLTQDGRHFYERSRDLVDDMDELHGMFQSEGRLLKGRLRVDMPGGMARNIVIPHLPEFLALHPGLSVELSATDRRVDVVREGFDCVLRAGSLEESSLVARTLGRMRLINCASPAYLSTYGLPETLEDLTAHRLVHYSTTLGQRPSGFEYSTDEGDDSLPMKGDITVNSGDAYTAAALAGLGIIQAPAIAMRQWLSTGQLVEILPHLAPPAMPVSIVYAQRRNLPARVRVFMDWIAELLMPMLERG